MTIQLKRLNEKHYHLISLIRHFVDGLITVSINIAELPYTKSTSFYLKPISNCIGHTY